MQNPLRQFTDAFRDGFLDGYAAALVRGPGAAPPAVPAVPYERYQKFLGSDGHALVQDYYLGFQYGSDVAGTSARPPAPVPAGPAAPAPVLMPVPSRVPLQGVPMVPPKTTDIPAPRPVPNTGKFADPKRGSDDPPLPVPLPPGAGRLPPLPKPEVPVIKPYNPDLTGSKFMSKPTPGLPEADRLPVPNPPLPITDSLPVPLAVPAAEPSPMVPPFTGPLPTPMPVSVPVFKPDFDTVPAILNDLTARPRPTPPK
jgi:hypothetical protein